MLHFQYVLVIYKNKVSLCLILQIVVGRTIAAQDASFNFENGMHMASQIVPSGSPVHRLTRSVALPFHPLDPVEVSLCSSRSVLNWIKTG